MNRQGLSKTSHLFLVLLPHGPPLNFNPKVFRLTFQLAVNSPSRCGGPLWGSDLDICGVGVSLFSKFFGPLLMFPLVFQIVWPLKYPRYFCFATVKLHDIS